MKVFKQPVSKFFPVLKFLALPAVAAAIVLSGCNGASDGGSLLGSSTSNTSTSTSTSSSSTSSTTSSAKIGSVSILLNSTNVSATGTVTASVSVLDVNHVVVTGQPVAVSASSGAISGISNSGVTDKNGVLTFNISAGSDTTPRAITLSASSGGVTQTATVNVIANQATSVKLGAGGSLVVLSTTQYSMPMNVLVTDASGQPAQNTSVTLSIAPINYYFGYLGWDATNKIYDFATGIGARVLGSCSSGGSCNPATLDQVIVTTNSNGYGYFNVIYSKNYAWWVDVAVTAQTTLNTTTATDVSQFTLSVLGTDVSSQGTTPPNVCSPFNPAGQYSAC